MPISQAEQEKREEARVARETARLIEEEQKYIEVIREQIRLVPALNKTAQEKADLIRKLNKLIDDQTTATETQTEALKDNLKEMDRQKTALSKLSKAYSETSDWMAKTAGKVKPLLEAYHSYSLEVQKIVDLSGRFTGKFQEGAKAFEKMRSELSLTRKEAADFGKTWSEAMRKGIDTEQFTRSVNNLRNVFGQKGGVAAIGQILQVPVSRATMQGVMGGNQASIAKAARNANLEQIYAMTGLSGAQKGVDSAQAARFEKTGAMVAKFRDDIEAGMAAGVQMGLGPEFAAMVVPLVEMNENIRTLVKDNAGIVGWVKTFVSGGGAAAGGAAVAAAGTTGGAAALTAAATTILAFGRSVLAKGPTVGMALATAGLGATADWAAEGIEDETATPFEVGAKEFLKGIGKVSRVAGYGLAGSLAGPEGTAVGLAYGVHKEYGGGRVDKTEPEIDAFNEALLRYGVVVDQMAKDMENTAKEIASLPSVLAADLAKSRLPELLDSFDPSAVISYADKAAKASAESMNIATRAYVEDINHLESEARRNRVEADMAEGMGDTNKAAGLRLIAENLEGQRTTRTAKYQEDVTKASLVPAAEEFMKQYEAQKGVIGETTQAARIEFERTTGKVGDKEALQNYMDQLDEAYDQTTKAREFAVENYQKNIQIEIDKQKKLIIEQKLEGDNLEQAERTIQAMENRLGKSDRQNVILARQQLAEQQKARIENSIAQSMAATETIEFKISERRVALLKAQESFVRERGASPEEIGALAGQQAGEARLQLNAFTKEFDKNLEDLQRKLQFTPPEEKEHRMQYENAIQDLYKKRLDLVEQDYKMQVAAATAGEKHRQDLIGANKHISEVQRDTAAKLGLSWRVQMGYQSQIIRASQADLQSKRKEVEEIARIGRESGVKPEDNLTLMKALGEYAQKQADLAESIMGKQRSFLEQATAASFGVGAGSKVSPILNPRMFGEMVQGYTGMRQAGAPMTMQEQQRNMQGILGPNVFGGIGGGMPGPGALPGMPPGVGGGGGGAPGGAPGGPGGGIGGGGGGGGMGGQCACVVSGQVRVDVIFNNKMFTDEVNRLITIAGQQGGAP